MKKILMIMLIIMNLSGVYSENEVEVIIPSFPVTINEMKIDSEIAKYPLIQYKGITYIPMTWNMCNALGLNVVYSKEDGLEITQANKQSVLIADSNGENSLSDVYLANLVDYRVVLNDRELDNAQEEYPLLNFKDITYFPLTWQFAHDEFNWNYQYSKELGLAIGYTVKEETNLEDEKKHVVSDEYKDHYPSEYFKHFMFEDLEVAEAKKGDAFFRKVTNTTDIFDWYSFYRYKMDTYSYHPNFALMSAKSTKDMSFKNEEDAEFYKIHSEYRKTYPNLPDGHMILMDKESPEGVYNTMDLYIRFYDGDLVITLMGPSYELLESTIETSIDEVFDEERGDMICRFIVDVIQKRYENPNNPLTIGIDNEVYNT